MKCGVFMSSNNVSDWLSGAALVISVASPMITAAINNISQRKLKKMELIDLRRADTISAYIQATGAYIQDPRPSTASAYGSAYGEIFLYTPQSMWTAISELNDKIINRDTAASMYQDFSQICMELSRLMKQKPGKPKKKAD